MNQYLCDMHRVKAAFLRICLAAAAMALCLIPAKQSHAQTSVTDYTSVEANETFNYGIKKDGTLEIRYYLGEGPDIVIPASIDGRKVTSIDTSFAWSRYLKAKREGMEVSAYREAPWRSIVVPEGVTRIGDYAFKYLWLSNITLPESLRYLGKGALYGNKIKSIRIPEGIREIRKDTFCWCEELTSVQLPQKLKKIGRNAFGLCWKLKELTVPAGTTFIGKRAFYRCGIKRLNILSKKIKKVEKEAFADSYEKSNIRVIKVPAGKKAAYKKLLKGKGLKKNVKFIS